MLLKKEKLQHINSITHEGKVVVFATDAQGKIHYTIKQDGFEDSYLNASPENRTGWEKWQELELPNEQEDDESVIEKETEELTYQHDTGKFILRSRYKTQDESAVAPVQLVSGMGHIYVFRQSKANTLLVDRFVLDGMTNKLVRKLDVRFKRSRQKYKPIGSMKKTDAGLSNIDALDYRDANGKPFYEPTTELSLVNNLYDGWFSVVLVPTNEHDNYRWHIFAYNSVTKKIEITTIRASAEGLFDVQDYTVMEPKPGAKNALIPRSIPGIIYRTLDLNGIEVGNGFSATKYDIQREQQTKDGMQLLKDATRIMLAIPTKQGSAAALSFAVAADGTLSQINENSDESNILRSNSRDLLLPLNTLDEIKAFGKSTPPPQGKITAVSKGEEDTVQITSPEASSLESGDLIQIIGTQSYNGHYKATKVDDNTFEVEASYVNGDIGIWEVVPEAETGLTFDGAITAFERVADNKLKVTAFNHGLEDGDEVQIVDTTDYNQTFGIEKINEKNFVIDGISWQSGEVVNLKSYKRRGVMFDGSEEYIAIPALELTPPSEEFAFGYTFSAWVYVTNTDNSQQIIIGEKNQCFQLLVNEGKVSFEVKFGDDSKQVTDTEAVTTNQWVHYAGIIKSDGTSNKTNLTLCKNGQQVGEILVEALPDTPENWQPEFEIGKSFNGKIAEVRIWDSARTVKEIKDSMYLQLTGREVDLAGYWRLGAITEGKERKVVDFSPNGNDGIVYGEAFVSAVTLKRTLGDRTTQVVKYSNDDLVAVTARATYVESFEFKVDADVDITSLFNFSYWGKKSRNSEEKIEFSGDVNTELEDLENGWYKATCRFTVPDGVAMMRTFELADVKGDWKNLEIRKHRVQLVSDSITEQKFTDSVELETLADENAELPGLLTTLEQKEREEASLLFRKWYLEDLIATNNKLTEGKNAEEVANIIKQKETQKSNLENEISNLKVEVTKLEAAYNQEKANPLNYWCKIRANANDEYKYFHFNGNKFLTRWKDNHAQFKFTAKGNGWYEIETDTSIGHLNVDEYRNRKYLHFNQQKVLCAWSDQAAQFKFEEEEDWYTAKLKIIHNLSDTNFQYLHFDRHNTLVAWEKTPAEFKFEIQDEKNPTNNRIKNAESRWDNKERELTQKRSDLKNIIDELKVLRSLSKYQQELKEVNELLGKIQSDLSKNNTEIITGIKKTPQALVLSEIAKDSRELTTKGALLEFVSSASRISAIETCEGNVQLSYLNNQGRMRLTNYDATSDSQNTAFEQWLPDRLPLCLNFANNDEKINLSNPISLQKINECTVETWFFYPLPKVAKNQNTLVATVDGKSIQVQPHNKKLGISIQGNFYDSGYSLEQLTPGWHHLTAVAKDSNTIFYIDARKVGDVREVLGKSAKETGITYFNIADSEISTIGNSASGSQQFGKLAEFRVWDIALSDEEIAVNSKTRLSGNEPGLIAYYPFNEATGEEVKNLAGNANYNGTVNGATWWGCTAPIGNLGHQVMEFDGVDDYVKLSSSVLNDLSSFTLEGWVKLNLQVSSKVSLFGQNDVIEFGFNDDGKLSGWVSTKDSIQTDDSYPLHTWHHVAFVGNGSNLLLYINGIESKSISHTPVDNYGSSSDLFKIGAGVWSGGTQNPFKGQISEVRIWNKARTAEEIKADMHRRLTGKESGLVAYLPLNEITLEQSTKKVFDLSTNNNHGTVNAAILKHSNTLPVVSNTLVSAEYSTVVIDKVTKKKSAIMRRFFASPTVNGVELLPEKRIEELELKWIGNAQFAPTLLGYIEGPPPVPSENLTVQEDYNGATSVELTMSEDVEFSWFRSQDSGQGSSFDLFAGIAGAYSGSVSDPTGIASIGWTIAEFKAGFKGNIDYSYQSQNESYISSSSSLNMTDRLELRGTQEPNTKFPHLGKRFIPKNVGYALVVSGLADVFITRLKRSKKMIGYQVQPVDGIPPDVNTITFLINPAYTMSGSLDGMTGTKATSDRFFRHVPEMRSQHGSLYPASYYRLQEAYDLKQQIEKEDKRRASYFAQFNAGLVDEDSLDLNIGSSKDFSDIGVNLEENQSDNESVGEDEQTAADRQADQIKKEAGAVADEQSEAVKKKQEEIDALIEDLEKRTHATDSFAGWQNKMEDIQIRARKRNIVNTYVWDADGGLRTEAQSFASTVEHTVGGSSTLDAGYGFQGDISAQLPGYASGIMGSAELTALATMNLTQTMSKTENRSKGFDLNVDLSGVESTGITDYKDYPIQPGEKVDRYRFMSFYLEGSTKHFNDFFDYVVDPEWLASNDEEARALRQAKGKANKTWRVLHRVTYVERPALMGFGRDTRQIDNELATKKIDDYLDDLAEENKQLRTQLSTIKNKLAEFEEVKNSIGELKTILQNQYSAQSSQTI